MGGWDGGAKEVFEEMKKKERERERDKRRCEKKCIISQSSCVVDSAF